MTSPSDGSAASAAAYTGSPADTATVTSSDQPATIPIDLGTAAAIGAALVSNTDPTSVFRRWGVINAINSNGTVDVAIDGAVVPGLSRNVAYVPTVGETVMLDVIGTDTSVVGAQAPSPRGLSRPIGIIEQYAGSTAPPGALLCNGQTVSRTTYAELWAWAQANSRVDTTGGLFGPGDGSTTFTVPDARGRNLIGVGTLAGDPYALGDIGGTAKPVIQTANMPVHNHSVAVADHATHNHAVSAVHSAPHTHGFSTSQDGQHQHDFLTAQGGDHGGHFPGVNGGHLAAAGTALGLAAWNESGAGSGTHNHGGTTAYNSNHGHTGTTGTDGVYSHTITQSTTGPTTHTVTQNNVGSGTAFDVRQPYLAINFIIWT